MRLSTRFSGMLALALAATAVASDVLDLTPANFESTVNNEDLVLVEFFAPWCGHCKALAPHYEEAATVLKSEKGIPLAKVNCVDEADLCQAHGVQGYPTLKVFRNGTPADYTGPRQADGIISYMTKQALPAVSEVTAANHDDFKQADKIVAVLYVATPTDAPHAEFSATAEKHRDDYLFGISSDPAAIEAAGVTPPAIVLYRKFDEPSTVYPYPVPSTTVSDLEQWIKDLSIPVIDQVGAENYAVYAQSGKPLAYLFVDPTDPKLQEHIDLIRPIALEHKDKLNFVWIDAIRFGDHAKALNLAEPKWPSFVIQDLSQQLKYPHDQSSDITHDNIKNHVAQFVAGKLEPQLKSQPIPETQNEPVYEVVGKSFDQVVLDDSKDVFIEFYATWCGHCKRLKPTWDSLGERFAEVKDRVIIAKMEATENDLPPSVPFRVSGFPTLKFKPAGSREFLDYEGDRSLESLIAFVEEHAKNSLAPTAQEPVSGDDGASTSQEHDHHDEL
ncbi:disulfide isomerase [Punctularia strigosozonata HHB-11173 SS5]|uniref:disulfide isomerase n=1 Tax=Punctularia strigosozonata (strain HHB-11173) TaxID=741275 RepID=UPI0004417327|nr:disulfide isomerase [Punctularia strigosozonata HHB-11173 SS5]EIN10656.1 disulfide isomerase [Punctularia strigosozonata HHB-11173 SS5]